MYGVKQSKTTSYNPSGNSKCEMFNQTLCNLLTTLPRSQKPNWPAHLNSLVFIYNIMLNSTTGCSHIIQCLDARPKHHVIIGLGLNNYDLNDLVSKSSWIQEHHKLMQSENQCTFKTYKKGAFRTG